MLNNSNRVLRRCHQYLRLNFRANCRRIFSFDERGYVYFYNLFQGYIFDVRDSYSSSTKPSLELIYTPTKENRLSHLQMMIGYVSSPFYTFVIV